MNVDKKPATAMGKNRKQSLIRRHGGLLLVAVVSGLSGFGAGVLGVSLRDDSLQNNSSAETLLQQRFISNESDLISAVAEQVGPSVVSISLTSQQQSFFGSFNSSGAGTGIILSEDGIVVTNRHVVPEGSSDIEITLSDGTVYSDVDVIGRDPRGGVDIAFLQINNVNGLTAAKIGNSDDMKVGDKVIAIGNALGEFQNSVTTGIISGRSRPITTADGFTAESLTNLLQTDAAINPGNSGGPLVNINGEVIGINTAVADGENIGFAIPISDVTSSIDSVITSGELVVPFIGVRFEPIDVAYAEEYNLDTQFGAYIRGRNGLDAVLPDSPAAAAGLQEHDIITEVDGVQVTTANGGLSSLLGRKKVGDEVTLRIIRGDETLDITVTLGKAPDTI